jgi:hypothetical protein
MLRRDLSSLQGFEIYQYEFEDVPETSPVTEVGFPVEALDCQYSGVTEGEVKGTLCYKVLEPYFNKHFPEVAQLSLNVSTRKRRTRNYLYYIVLPLNSRSPSENLTW